MLRITVSKSAAAAKSYYSEGLSKQDYYSEKDEIIGGEGEYFLSSGGSVNHHLTGTLTSAPFKVTQPFAAFSVSGGAIQDTRVELCKGSCWIRGCEHDSGTLQYD